VANGVDGHLFRSLTPEGLCDTQGRQPDLFSVPYDR
jgi:hypothetical protein